MVHKDQRIELVAEYSKSEVSGYRSVYFTRPPHFTFDAGDWIDIVPKSGTLTGGKTYSLSSSPTEGDLRITFREGLSELKRLLQNIEAGHKLFISQYGNDYDFQLQHNKSSVLIAGGVGIAPFRSMLKEMSDTSNHNEVHLIYLNQTDNFLFKDELDEWQSALPNLAVHYIETKTLNRKKRQKQLLSLINGTHHYFYISGPPAMVEDTEHLLIDEGVNVKNIRIDSFGGY